MTPRPSTLILGWGNPGRGDDGLGPAFIEALSAYALPAVELASDYQLNPEDAADAARHGRVVFVDADRLAPAPFRMRRLRPGRLEPAFTTHGVEPGAVLALCRDLFGAEPEAWLLGIRGYAFDAFDDTLSLGARANLARALEFVRTSVASGSFGEGDRCPNPSA